MVDVTYFVGKFCVIQFKRMDPWLISQSDDDAAVLAIHAGTPAAVPVFQGTIVEAGDGCFFVSYDSRGATMRSCISTDAVLSITCVASKAKSLIIS